MSEPPRSSRRAIVICLLLTVLLLGAGLVAALAPRLLPVPWFAPVVLAIVAFTCALTFRDADDNSRHES